MPYRRDEVDLECSQEFCGNNTNGFCMVDENVEELNADDKELCTYFYSNGDKEFTVEDESEMNELIFRMEENGIDYKSFNDSTNRFVLKAIEFIKDGEKQLRAGLFRMTKEDEDQMTFYAHVDGGIAAKAKLEAEADLFRGQV